MTPPSFYFDPAGDGLRVFLGPTEAELMELAWEHKTLTVKSALFFLGDRTPRAYTTVMTVLARLADKGLLTRRKDGRTYAYSPAVSRDEFLQSRTTAVRDCLKRNFPKS